MQLGTVCIIGPGLIGGSIGLGLKKRNLAKTIIGVGHRSSAIEKALKMRAIDIGSLNIEEAVKNADIVILATSVNQIVDIAKKVIPFMKSNTILTDVGSTKNYIVEQITYNIRKDIAFVGAHPIAGSEQSGVEYATPNLFEGCTCIITPLRDQRCKDQEIGICEIDSPVSQPPDYTKALETISRLWQLLGAKIKYLTPKQHDEILASVSHLPHLIASCLINAIKKEHLGYGASGLRDTTRIASGDPDLWINIFDQNRGNVIQSIDQFMIELTEFRNDLLKKNNATLLDRLKRAQSSRNSVFHNKSTNPYTNK